MKTYEQTECTTKMRWCALVWPANKVCAGRTSAHHRLFNTRFNCFPPSLAIRSLNLIRLHDHRQFVVAIRPTASLDTLFNFSSTRHSDLLSNPQPIFTWAHPPPSSTTVISAPPLRLRERLKRKTNSASTASCLDVVAWVSFDTLTRCQQAGLYHPFPLTLGSGNAFGPADFAAFIEEAGDLESGHVTWPASPKGKMGLW